MNSHLAPGAVPSREERLKISLTAAWDVEAVLRVPTESDPKEKRPVVLIFGGFEEAGGVLSLIHPNEPVILASFDYPYRGSRKISFPSVLLELGKFREGVALTQIGISKLVATLKKRSDVDVQKIAIVGASFGAPFAIRAAADEADIRGLIIVHGFADVRGTIRHRLKQVFTERLGSMSGPAAWIASGLLYGILNPPDPEADVLKLRSDQSVLMIEATEDQFLPLNARTLLWDSLQKSPVRKKRIPMAGDHLQPGAHGLIDDIIAQSLSWLRELGWF